MSSEAKPLPPGESKQKDVRYLDIREGDEFDEHPTVPGAEGGVVLVDRGAGRPDQFEAHAVRIAPDTGAIQDFSFEQGPPPASGWTLAANNTCGWIGNHSSAWGINAALRRVLPKRFAPIPR